MSATTTGEPELEKLAHVLGVPLADLDMLRGVPGADVRELRSQISEALFRADKHYFARMAAVTRTVPSAISAKITELTLPPLLAARTAELLDPDRAVDLTGRLSDRYVADVSSAMDPARSPQVVRAMPAERVAMISRELARRQEWIVIGGFASVVGDAGLRASVATFDGEQLLRIGYVMDDLDRIDEINLLLTDGQVDAMLEAAARVGLWRELGVHLAHMGGARQARLAGRFAAAEPTVRAAAAEAAGRGELSAVAFAALSGTVDPGAADTSGAR